MKKIFKKLTWAICVFFVFSSLLLQSVSAKGNNSVSFYGRWEEGANLPCLNGAESMIYLAFSPSLVVAGVLSIHSSTQRSDITICILKDGKVLYEKMIPASKTDCVTIDLSEFEPGTYTVGLKNQWDDCLWGEFYANYDKKWSYDQNCIGC